MGNIAEIKSSLHHYIADIDDVELLAKFQDFIREQLSIENKIVAYTSAGTPLTQATYKKDIDEAIAQARNQETISQEDLEKELEE